MNPTAATTTTPLPMSTAHSRLHPIHLMADHNHWMNTRLYDAARTLSPEALVLDRGAFFGSVLGTLNHLVVADTVWLQRLAHHPALQARLCTGQLAELDAVCQLPAPTRLDETVCTTLDGLWQRRQVLDRAILAMAHALNEPDLDEPLEYFNMKNMPQRKFVFSLLLHFFNHQTHHRGQATTLLSQAGVDVGVTDLLALIPDAPAAKRG